jgi:hypothetical protein
MRKTDRETIEHFRDLIRELEHSPCPNAREALIGGAFDNWFRPSHNWTERWLISMSLGPWKIPRTETIRDHVLKELCRRHLETLSDAQIAALGFPLEWQTRYTAKLAIYLQNSETTMDRFCSHLRTGSGLKARGELQAATGAGESKCIDYFVREALQLDVFPIDRWVRRLLSNYGIPESQEQLIELCYATGQNVRYVARAAYLHGSGN